MLHKPPRNKPPTGGSWNLKYLNHRRCQVDRPRTASRIESMSSAQTERRIAMNRPYRFALVGSLGWHIGWAGDEDNDIGGYFAWQANASVAAGARKAK